MNSSEALLEAMGVRVRHVVDLSEGALFLKKSKLLLLDIDISHDEINQVIEEVLPAAFESIDQPSTH